MAFAQNKRILILHSYSQEYPWTKSQNNGFTQTLINSYSPGIINFSTEYLDTKRIEFNKNYQDFFFNYLKQKFAFYSPDLIFCSDDNALNFLLQFKNKLFEHVPVVFCGINNLDIEKRLDRRQYTGIFEQKEIVPNLVLLQKISTRSDNILFFGDNSDTHQAIEQKIKNDIASQFISQKYTILASNNFSSLINQFKLHKEGVVFLTSIGGIKDEKGDIVPLKKTIASIAQAGNFMIISMEDAYLEKEVLGGYVTSGFSQGEEAANLAIQILKGHSPSSIPLVRESPNKYMFNYSQLERVGLAISKLPEKSIILNKPQSFYDQYKIWIQSAVLFLIFQTFVIFFLIQNIAKRKKAERSLQQARDELEQKVIERTSQLTKTNASLSKEIVERQQIENALKESEERFKSLHNASFGGITIHDKGIILDCNRGLADMTGFSIEELIGMDGLKLIAPEWRESVMDKILSGFDSPYDVEGLHKNNIKYDLRIQGKNIPYHGSTVRVTEFRDITETKRAEKEKINDQKIIGEQKQLALVGQVAGKMAHDFNNILGIIMGNAELSLDDCKDEQIRETLELIFEQTLRGKNLTKNLVAFANDQEPKQEFFSICEKIDLVLSLLKKDLESIELIRENKSDIPDLLADAGMIEHALVNLIQNSIHATSLTAKPKIIVRSYCLNGNICLEMEDNGCGIPKKYLENIYTPSFTLKGSKDVIGSYKAGIKGTGYGMSNVKKYIKQHKGNISVESESGRGTKIVITLPVIRKELTSAEKIEFQKENQYFGKYILLVEDELAISDIQYRLLTAAPFNHKVDIAHNGQTAIDLCEKNIYDFISLDYILPGNINGMDIYNHIRKANKNIPILFISGNIEFLESIKQLKQKDTNVDHISKPCQNKDYIRSINGLLKKALIPLTGEQWIQ